ncbi:MAG: Bax inhibitor-1/YccA family protein [Mucilaginibacter sp.]
MDTLGQDNTVAIPTAANDAGRRFMATVFLWMFAGLAITSACIYAFNTYTYCMRLIFANDSFTMLAWLALIGPFVISFIIRKGINAISFFGLCILFILYAALIGGCFAFILLEFVDSSLFGIFLASCLVFGAAAVIGYRTKTDLTQFKPILYMLLAGIILITPVVFIFPDLDMTLIVGYIGVIVFIGMSALHFQDIRDTGAGIDLNDPSAKKLALLSALTMYVDFVNLFFFIVAIFVKRK